LLNNSVSDHRFLEAKASANQDIRDSPTLLGKARANP
jgi:hypothetical protein